MHMPVCIYIYNIGIFVFVTYTYELMAETIDNMYEPSFA